MGRLIKKMEHTWKSLIHDGVSLFLFPVSVSAAGDVILTPPPSSDPHRTLCQSIDPGSTPRDS